jgi:nucleotide-binding universal stress UspA family protein
MKTIIVATDFSPAASNASNYAADMALALDATLLLLHVYEIPVVYQEVPVAITVAEVRQNAETAVNKLAAELTARTGNKLKIDTELRVGEFFHQLDAVCQRVHPYSVVMGSQGTTAMEHLLFGSHTVYAVKHLNWPLITVPPTAGFSRIKKIGLACDFEHVLDILPVAEIKQMVTDFQAELHILNTAKENDFNEDIVYESGVIRKLLAPVEPNYHFISSANVDESIMSFAEKTNIDLLMVLPKRHGFFDKLLHQSHIKKFVLHSHVPVLSLHH